MPDSIQRLLAAERRGRALALREEPGPGDLWRIAAGPGDDGCAFLAAARWAARFGADVKIELAKEQPADQVWHDLAASARKLDLVSAVSKTLAASRLVLAQGDADWEITELPDDRESWRTPLAASWHMVRPVDADCPRMTTAQCRRVDASAIERFGVPGLCLMENASVAAAAAAIDMLDNPLRSRVLIAIGGGNNGGDGLAVARGLDSLGVKVEAALLKPAESLRGDVLANYRLLREADSVPLHHLAERPESLAPLLSDQDLLIDALLGTGFKGALSPAFRTAIEAINRAGKPVLGLDLPSGLDGDTGEAAETAVRCRRTITFAAVKVGLEKGVGPELTGELYLGDIGAPSQSLTDA